MTAMRQVGMDRRLMQAAVTADAGQIMIMVFVVIDHRLRLSDGRMIHRRDARHDHQGESRQRENRDGPYDPAFGEDMAHTIPYRLTCAPAH